MIRTIDCKDFDRRSILEELHAKINRLSPSLSETPQANRLIDLRRESPLLLPSSPPVLLVPSFSRIL